MSFVPSSFKNAWQWLRLTGFWLLPEHIQQRIWRKAVFDQISSGFEKFRRELDIGGDLIELGGRFLRLEDDGFIICVDLEQILSGDDPCLSGVIITRDLTIFHMARSMLLQIAAALNVPMILADLEDFWQVDLFDNGSMKCLIVNAVFTQATLWTCLGCEALFVFQKPIGDYWGECRCFRLADHPAGECDSCAKKNDKMRFCFSESPQQRGFEANRHFLEV